MRYVFRIMSITQVTCVIITFLFLQPLKAFSGTDVTDLKVRKPVFAGSFYPADKASLSSMIDSYLKEAEQKSFRPDLWHSSSPCIL
jgi:hypothetical protein